MIDLESFFSNINIMSVLRNKRVSKNVRLLRFILQRLQEEESSEKEGIKRLNDLYRVALTLTEKTCHPTANGN